MIREESSAAVWCAVQDDFFLSLKNEKLVLFTAYLPATDTRHTRTSGQKRIAACRSVSSNLTWNSLVSVTAGRSTIVTGEIQLRSTPQEKASRVDGNVEYKLVRHLLPCGDSHENTHGCLLLVAIGVTRKPWVPFQGVSPKNGTPLPHSVNRALLPKSVACCYKLTEKDEAEWEHSPTALSLTLCTDILVYENDIEA